MLGGIGAGCQLAIDGGLGQQVGVDDHALYGALDAFNRLAHQADFVLAGDFQLEAQVAGGHLVGGVECSIDRLRDRACDEPGKQRGQ